jgi:DNA-binding SARP family transcriptional activator/predicted ATPase/Tfp pilus assembly protein PilF
VRVGLLGTFSLSSSGRSIRLESVKCRCLLGFLAVEPGSHERSRLAGLLWPEIAEEKACRNLRHAVWEVRQAFGPAAGAVVGSRHHLALAADGRVEVDAAALMDAVRTPRPSEEEAVEEMERAAGLFRGDLLDGVSLADAEEFETWLVAQRERHRAHACELLGRLIRIRRRGGDTPAALAHARRLVALEPWQESAHRAVMELLALLGEPAAALAQFESCRRILAEQLQTSPTAETVRLATRIRGIPGSSASTPPATPLLRHNLPVAATPFFGRDEELEAIGGLLARAECRALCLLGPGGIGKTRLALQAAHRVAASEGRDRGFPDGVWFVTAREASGAGFLLPAIAGALGLVDSREADAAGLGALLAHLATRRVLIVVDGFEHILEEGAAAAALLAAAPGAKLLLTSRERPSLDGAWMVEVGGLPRGKCPRREPAPAIQLFLETARRVRFGFEAGDEDRARIGEICQAVDGSPLAIELAAGWVRSLPVAAIASELAGSPGFLARSEDHRLRGVFERSYERLPTGERRALRALSAMAGGISGEAALAVAGTGPAVLRALADRSFLRFDPASGRHHLHEVLRFFAGERLAAEPGERQEVLARHASFFGDLLRRREDAVWRHGDHDAVEALSADLPDLGAAWEWAISRRETRLLGRCLPAFAALHAARGLYAEGEARVGRAVEALEDGASVQEAGGPEPGLLPRLLVTRAGLRNRLGRYDEAVADLERALSAPDASLRGGDRAAALLHLGEASLLQGRFAVARRRLEESIALSRTVGDRRWLADALARFGRVLMDEGRHGAARTLFEESLAAAREVGNRPAILFATTQLGFVDYFDGALETAERTLGEALEMARASADPAAAALALQGLGFVAEDRGGRLEEASARYREALAICQEHGDRLGAGRNLMLLGEVARKQRRFADARLHYHQSLEINRSLGSAYLCGLLHGNLALTAVAVRDFSTARREVRAALREYRASPSFNLVLEPLVAIAEMEHAEGRSARALELLGLVRSHPGNRQDHRVEQERVLEVIRNDRPGLDVETPLARGRALDLEAEVDRCLESQPAPAAS